MTLLLQTLQALEMELHHRGARCSSERLQQLLHGDFHEVGRSGRAYNREAIINYLPSQESQPEVKSGGFSVLELGPDAALLTYRSAHVEEGKGLVNHTLRSSLWVKVGAIWQLRYHQGTAAAATWQVP